MALRVELPPFSMFSRTPLYDNIPVEMDGVMEPVAVFGLMVDAVVPDPSDELRRVSQSGGNRLDRISNEVYGTPHLWPVLARINNLDPMIGLPVGAEIVVPTRARLASAGLLST